MSEHLKQRGDRPYKKKLPQKERRDCPTGKVAFVSPRDANHAAMEMRNTRELHGDLEPFLCEHCSFYHLGGLNEAAITRAERTTEEYKEGEL